MINQKSLQAISLGLDLQSPPLAVGFVFGSGTLRGCRVQYLFTIGMLPKLLANLQNKFLSKYSMLNADFNLHFASLTVIYLYFLYFLRFISAIVSITPPANTQIMA